MSTTMEILAATERRLRNSVETCAELRTRLAQAEREREAVREQFIKRDAAALALQACFNATAWEAERLQGELDAAHQELLVSRAQVQRLREALGECPIRRFVGIRDNGVKYWTLLIPSDDQVWGWITKCYDILRGTPGDTEPHGKAVT